MERAKLVFRRCNASRSRMSSTSRARSAPDDRPPAGGAFEFRRADRAQRQRQPATYTTAPPDSRDRFPAEHQAIAPARYGVRRHGIEEMTAMNKLKAED